MNIYIVAFTSAFIAMDFATGFLQALLNKCLDSAKMRDGLKHKCGFVVTIILAACIEWAMQFVDLGFTLPLFVPVCTWIVLTEIVSIFENACKMNPELANSKLAQLFNIDTNA